MNLKVGYHRKYDGNFPTYNLPIEIGYFSINSDGKFCNDKHQMKYLAMPKNLRSLHMDLEEGYSQYIYISEETEDRFSALLRWIISHQDVVKKHFVDRFTSSTKIDFVCYRGTLSGISSTIYEKSEDWWIIASKYKSTIYLTSVQTERKSESEERKLKAKAKSEELNRSFSESEERKLKAKAKSEERNRSFSESDEAIESAIEIEDARLVREQHMCTWGFKFEQYMTSDAMNTTPNTSVPVNENEKYYTVTKGKLKNHVLLFCGEVDAVNPAHFDDPGHDPTSVLRYVELKTSRVIEYEKQDRNFRRFKLLSWYLQSFLIGIPQVICGFRDDGGIVRELGVFNVRDLPKIAKNLWSPAACLNFCSHFLDYVKRTVVKDYTTTAYSFYWKPGSEIICEEIPGSDGFLCDGYAKNLTLP